MKSISILSKGKKNNKQQQNVQNNKPVEQKLQFKYSYSIIPTNFVNLSEENQAQKMVQFFDILRVIEDRIKITMSRRMVPITVEGIGPIFAHPFKLSLSMILSLIQNIDDLYEQIIRFAFMHILQKQYNV